MGLFDKFIAKEHSSRNTTKNFFIGATEAEAESCYNSKIKLNDVFADFLNILPELQHEKFIITGRKGSGKTAIAEYINIISHNEYNYFCDFIKKNDVNIEQIVQIGKNEGVEIEKELLFEWIILIKLVKLLISNEAIQNEPEIKDLNLFLKKNSGFVDIKSNQILEVIKKSGFDVNINFFKRFLLAKFGNRYDIKGDKAPFYKLIPHLKATIENLISCPENIENKYILIFDDLDIGFNATKTEHINTILQLLRICKDYNINFFGKKGIDAKIIVLLRDDISRILIKNDADSAKIFSSYEIPLIWYEHELFKKNENLTKIKQFINKRIEHNFIKNKIDFNQKDPWSTFVADDASYRISSFKYVLEHTFARPRDLVLFFKPLPSLELPIPLRKHDINSLIGRFSNELMSEIKNELSAHFVARDIDILIKSLGEFANESCFEYEELKESLTQNLFSSDVEYAIQQLFEYSLIGNQERDNSGIIFKHWEGKDEPIRLNKSSYLILHFSMKVYYANN
jgi:energy-coupling factor transporter ATP-binding protein EcfA2